MIDVDAVGLIITAIMRENAGDIGDIVAVTRSHWKIESLHWLLDVIWDEDNSGILSENGNKTLNSFRKTSIKANVISALLNDAVILDVVRTL